jgi:ABC-type transport system substrate-binding protein
MKGSGKVIPWLATDWKYNADYTTLTFTLRKGVKFHDGTDFNAAAAKFSLDLVLNSTLVDLKTLSSIDAVDDSTLRLNLKTYDSALLISLASYLCPMVSPTAVNSMGKDAAMLHPVGTGPFKFVSYTRDVSIKYAKFTDYWQKGKPYLDALEFVLIADPVTQLASFKAGEAQVMRAIAIADAASLQATGKYMLAAQEMAIDCLATDSAHISSPFCDIRVRQAIAYAIDNAAVAKAIGMSFFTPCNQLISPTNYAYNPNVVGYPYNVAKAKQLLADAGYPKGFDTKLSYRAGAFEGDYCTLIQGYLKAVGINVQLDLAESARFNDLRVKGFQNQMVHYTMPAGAEKDMSYYFRDRLSSKGSMFTSATVYIPSDYDSKLMTVNIERDDAKRIALLQDVDKMAVDTYLLVIPIQVETAVSATSNLVKDSDIYKYYAMCYHAENVWLSK